jgi:hypothetical protein
MSKRPPVQLHVVEERELDLGEGARTRAREHEAAGVQLGANRATEGRALAGVAG